MPNYSTGKSAAGRALSESYNLVEKEMSNYPNFKDIYYLELGIIVSVGGFHKPSLPKLAVNGRESTIKRALDGSTYPS